MSEWLDMENQDLSLIFTCVFQMKLSFLDHSTLLLSSRAMMNCLSCLILFQIVGNENVDQIFTDSGIVLKGERHSKAQWLLIKIDITI